MEIKNVPNYEQYQANENGDVISKKTGLPIKKIPRKDGYINSHIFSHKEGRKKIYKLKLAHRLIAAAFFGESKLEVNHINGDKSDNRISNLEYVTRSQNIRHSIDVLGNRHSRSGFDSGASKISKEDHIRIVNWYKKKIVGPKDLATFFNVNQETIMNHIRNSKRILNGYS